MEGCIGALKNGLKIIMTITYKVTETGNPKSSIVFQTTVWEEAIAWFSKDYNMHYCIHYEGVNNMSIDEFNAHVEVPARHIISKRVITD